MLNPKQLDNIKKQLLEQLEQTNLPNKVEIKSQVKAMNAEQLEQFLIQNKLIKEDGKSQPAEQKCIFCSLVFGDIPSYKISEDNNSIAILELNPVSRGHTLVIPKEHSEKAPETAIKFAEEVSKKLKAQLKSKEIAIQNSSLFGHEIINVIPVYKNENLNSPRQQAEPEELQELQKLLEIKPKSKPKTVKASKPKKIKETKAKKLWLPQRIP